MVLTRILLGRVIPVGIMGRVSGGEDKKIIYQMNRVGKGLPERGIVLKDISLSYYYGAKIGVLGLNGSGKSTLLKIMAGLDEDHLGQTHLSKGTHRGSSRTRTSN